MPIHTESKYLSAPYNSFRYIRFVFLSIILIFCTSLWLKDTLVCRFLQAMQDPEYLHLSEKVYTVNFFIPSSNISAICCHAADVTWNSKGCVAGSIICLCFFLSEIHQLSNRTWINSRFSQSHTVECKRLESRMSEQIMYTHFDWQPPASPRRVCRRIVCMVSSPCSQCIMCAFVLKRSDS